MDGFSYWIFGYQKFAEPIIRECICMKKGWEDIFAEVQTPTISEIIKNTEERIDWDNEFPILKHNAIKELTKRKRRIVLDAAFIETDGSVVIGEFKSWGGYEKFDIKKLYETITQGKFFPDRLAINEVSYKGQVTEVSKFVIATNLADQENDDIIWEIGDLVVEVLDIADLLNEYGEAVAEKCGSWIQLEKSIKEVKEYIRTGGL